MTGKEEKAVKLEVFDPPMCCSSCLPLILLNGQIVSHNNYPAERNWRPSSALAAQLPRFRNDDQTLYDC